MCSCGRSVTWGTPTQPTIAPGRGAKGLKDGVLGADTLEHRVRAHAARELLDTLDTLVATFRDDLGRAEVAGDALPVLMAAHRDDPLRTQLRRGEDTREADGAVAHDHDGAPRLDVRAD